MKLERKKERHQNSPKMISTSLQCYFIIFSLHLHSMCPSHKQVWMIQFIEKQWKNRFKKSQFYSSTLDIHEKHKTESILSGMFEHMCSLAQVIPCDYFFFDIFLLFLRLYYDYFISLFTFLLPNHLTYFSLLSFKFKFQIQMNFSLTNVTCIYVHACMHKFLNTNGSFCKMLVVCHFSGLIIWF